MSEPTGSLESRYVELQRLAMFLLDKLGGSVTITEQEQDEVDFDGMEIHTWRDPATFAFEVRLVCRNRDMVAQDPWPDVWSDYQSIFDRLKLTEDEARDLITLALDAARVLGVRADANSIADALKEFVVLCQERRGEGADLPGELAAAVITLSAAANDEAEQRAAAVNLFGARGVRLHRVLAELRWRILDHEGRRP